MTNTVSHNMVVVQILYQCLKIAVAIQEKRTNNASTLDVTEKDERYNAFCM